jgi:ClpP class serine protease
MFKFIKKLFKRNNMKLQRIIQKVYVDPVLITETGHMAVRQLLETKLANDMITDWKAKDEDEDLDLFGDPLPKPYDIVPSIRVIPVNGTIMQKAGMLEEMCGAVSTQKIKGWIQEAEADANIDTIVFDIESPGGEVTGTPELADYIAKCKIKTIAVSDSLVASAAYWIASSCDEIYSIGKTAEWGSIGCYSYILDVSKMYDNAGIKVEVFKDSKLKGIGIPGVPLNDDQRAYLQGEVDKIGKMFRDHVRVMRGNVPDEVMQGQTHMAIEAEQNGLIDGIVDSIEDIFA